MFDVLSDRLEEAWKKLRGQDAITHTNIQETLKEVRRALLEADVNLQVVKNFIIDVEKSAIGIKVIGGVNPGQQFIKVVYEELVKVMGESASPLARAENNPTVILMVGLQGTGKTTATAKLAHYLKKQKQSCLMVAADIYRPAAIDQLKTLGEQIEIPVFELGNQENPVDIAIQGVNRAKEMDLDVVIIDTAGRLQVDQEMMLELAQIKESINPDDTLLVVDAMTGQEAANLAQVFHEQIKVTGTILTKMDGDTRGGAALSVRQVSGQPIKFVGVGEKIDALQLFYPDRMASRILNMGDILTLVEKAQEEIDLSDMEQLQSKILDAKFDFNDFLKQTRLMKSMGSFSSILKMVPGLNKINTKDIEKGESELKRTEAMIGSMTLEERKNPDLLAKSPSRRNRIAKGSGHSETEISKLIKNFTRMRTMMQQLGKGGIPGMGSGIPGMGSGIPGMGNGIPSMGDLFGQKGNQKKKTKKVKKKKGFGDL
ncbi:MAG: signal recognition particle protein [Candidatus Atelocyanobacterium thalassa]